MPVHVVAAIALIVLVSGPAMGGEDYSPTASERLGSLRIGMSGTELNGAIECHPIRGPEEHWGADGAYHQTWAYADCGIELGMVSEKKGGAKSIKSISVAAPSDLRTQSGIGIGSTEKALIDAYGSYRNAQDSEVSGGFVAGSLFDGLIFQLEGGKVSSIFLGAASE